MSNTQYQRLLSRPKAITLLSITEMSGVWYVIKTIFIETSRFWQGVGWLFSRDHVVKIREANNLFRESKRAQILAPVARKVLTAKSKPENHFSSIL